MGASSITGTGDGESFGKYKRDNNIPCCASIPEKTSIVQEKTSCYTRLNVSSRVVYNPSSKVRIKVCG